MVPSLAHGLRLQTFPAPSRLALQRGLPGPVSGRHRAHRSQATAQAQDAVREQRAELNAAAASGHLSRHDSAAAPPQEQTPALAPPPPTPAVLVPALPPDALKEFEHKLEADIETVAATLTAVTGVIIFWRGVWSLLDYYVGDSVFGDICCILVGLTIILWIRLSGIKVAASLWPPS